MKQLESKSVQVGDTVFYIRPFGALKAANLSGELAVLFVPLVAALAPLAQVVSIEEKDEDAEDETNIMDMEVESIAPMIGSAFSSLSGDKLERLLRLFLIDNKNISFDDENGKTKLLTEDELNEIFCEEVQDMYILTFHVIKVNYKGFFEKLGNQFGNLIKKSGIPSLKNMVN